MGTTPREPETESGKRLLDELHSWSEDEAVWRNTDVPMLTTAILAIEAQAAAAERQRLADEVEGLPRITMAYPPDDPVHRAAVLRLLRADGGAA